MIRAARKITIRDIAARAGVSIGTASNVLNNKPNVDPHLSAKVMEAVEALNYRVNLHARGMILRRSFNVGIVIPSLTDPFFPVFADGLERCIEDQGSHVVIASSRNDAERERSVCDSLVAKQVDGLIVTPCSADNILYFNQLVDEGLPIVQLGRYFDEVRAPVVMADNFAAGSAIAEYLVGLGHSRLLHLAASTRSSPDRERTRGFSSAAARLGLQSRCKIIEVDRSDGMERALFCFDAEQPPTGVFADDDSLAIAFLRACQRRRIFSPSDFSLVSIGPPSSDSLMMPRLTKYVVDAAAMSEAAAGLLFRRIYRDTEEDAPTSVVVPVSLVPGETVAGASEV